MSYKKTSLFRASGDTHKQIERPNDDDDDGKEDDDDSDCVDDDADDDNDDDDDDGDDDDDDGIVDDDGEFSPGLCCTGKQGESTIDWRGAPF